MLAFLSQNCDRPPPFVSPTTAACRSDVYEVLQPISGASEGQGLAAPRMLYPSRELIVTVANVILCLYLISTVLVTVYQDIEQEFQKDFAGTSLVFLLQLQITDNSN